MHQVISIHGNVPLSGDRSPYAEARCLSSRLTGYQLSRCSRGLSADHLAAAPPRSDRRYEELIRILILGSRRFLSYPELPVTFGFDPSDSPAVLVTPGSFF